jgi:hypothetical protein
MNPATPKQIATMNDAIAMPVWILEIVFIEINLSFRSYTLFLSFDLNNNINTFALR